MGYLFTPTQQEKDNDFINSTLEDLKTTNLLKQAQDKANAANANAQNTNIPQTTISQTSAQNAKENNNINMGINVLTMNPQNTNTTQSTQQNTQQIPTRQNTQIALSSDKNFNPQQTIEEQPQTKPQTTRLLQKERDNINFNKSFDSSPYARGNTAFLGKPKAFSNYKLAMEAKSRLYDNYADDTDEKELAEITKRHRLLDKAVEAMETAKANFGENSKEYKKILNDYMQYGILRDNNIKDYASLAQFYTSGGNVGLKASTKDTNSSNESNVKNENNSNNTYKSIDDFMDKQKEFVNKQMINSDESNLEHITKRAMGKYDTASQINARQQNKEGLNASNAISLMADKQALNNATKAGLDKVNNTQDSYYKDKANATQQEYDEAVADIIEGSYSSKRMDKMSKDWDENKGFLTHAGNIAMIPLDMSADALKSGSNMIYKGMTEGAFNNKADLVLNEIKMFDKDGASMQVFGSGESKDNLIQMSNYLDNALEADKKSSIIWKNEVKPKLVEYLRAKGENKEKAWTQYQTAMQKLNKQWDNAPSKLLADSKLVGLAETMRNQHDYGRFVFNLFKNPNENRELAQSYLNDLHTILKANDKYKDVSEVVLTKSGQVAVKIGNNYETMEQGFLESILHGIHDSVNEIGLSVGGAIAGGMKGASMGKNPTQKIVGGTIGAIAGGAVGAGLGAIADEQINSWTTNYKNADGGLKRGLEAATLNVAGDIILGGGAYAIKQGAKGLNNIANLSIKDSVNNLKDKATLFANGNVNAVADFLARNSLEQSEREAITKQAQDGFLNGKSLAEYKSDVSIPKLERLKNAFKYEKFINKESMAKGKEKLEALSKEFENFQTTSMESNRPIMSLLQDMFEGVRLSFCDFLLILHKSLRSLPLKVIPLTFT